MRNIFRDAACLMEICVIIICSINYSFANIKRDSNISRPNIIIIFMDDMGYGDPECYNGTLYSTPNINKLAAEGMRFTNFYAVQAICTASRAGLLTGCYPQRVSTPGVFFPWTPIALNPKETTIASMLKKTSYRTGMVGKWHLGAEPPYWPTSYGFDEFTGLPYSNDMWPHDYDGTPITDTSDWRIHYPRLPLIEGNRIVRYIDNLNDQGELTSIYTEKACRFIEKNNKLPFFLYMAHSMPHVPIAASKKFRRKSQRGLYGDVMMEIDWSVGEIMKTLKEQGLDQNTLVIFTSDNGPNRAFGNHAGNSGGLREGKGTTWEGGQRESCIMRWPAIIPAGTICSKLGATIDFLPTLAEICGGKLPTEKIDGVSILSLLLNDPNANPREELAFYLREDNLQAIRKGRWKLVFPHTSASVQQKPPGKNGFLQVSTLKVEMGLFDLSIDPGETVDVKSSYPKVVQELKAVAEKYRKQLGDDLTHVPCTECRPPAVFTPSIPVPQRRKGGKK